MIKIINPLPISEEMLGAYLEGNLSVEDVLKVESVLDSNSEFQDFVNNLTPSEAIEECSIFEDEPVFGNNFELPEVPGLLVDIPDNHMGDVFPESFANNIPFPMVAAHSYCCAECVAVDEICESDEIVTDEHSLVGNEEELDDSSYEDNDLTSEDGDDMLIDNDIENDILDL